MEMNSRENEHTSEGHFHSNIDHGKDSHEMDSFKSDDLTVFVSFLCGRFWNMFLPNFQEGVFISQNISDLGKSC